jgi:hypothetical protein
MVRSVSAGSTLVTTAAETAFMRRFIARSPWGNEIILEEMTSQSVNDASYGLISGTDDWVTAVAPLASSNPKLASHQMANDAHSLTGQKPFHRGAIASWR